MSDRSGLFGIYGRNDQTENISVSGTLSPYLNVNPALVPNPDSQFITLDGSGQKRGRFELSFNIIGTCVLTGGSLGGSLAMFQARHDLRQAARSKVARTKALNLIAKQSASGGQAWGTAALLYSAIAVGVSWLRGADDELNTLFSGASAGIIYYASGGLRKSMMGGVGGLSIAGLYCMITSRDRLKQIVGL